MTLFTLVLIVVVVLAIIGITQEAQASTIEVPTYDPPMTHITEGAQINGTKMLDYTANEDIASVIVPWYNLTVFVDVTDYNECLAKVAADIPAGPKTLQVLTNNETETIRVLSLSPDEQKEFAMDNCLGDLYVLNALEEFGKVFP